MEFSGLDSFICIIYVLIVALQILVSFGQSFVDVPKIVDERCQSFEMLMLGFKSHTPIIPEGSKFSNKARIMKQVMKLGGER